MHYYQTIFKEITFVNKNKIVRVRVIVVLLSRGTYNGKHSDVI